MHLEDVTHRLIVVFASLLAGGGGLLLTLFLQIPVPVFIYGTGLGDWWRALPNWIPFLVQTLQMVCWFALSVYLMRRFSNIMLKHPLCAASVSGVAAGTFLFSMVFFGGTILSLLE